MNRPGTGRQAAWMRPEHRVAVLEGLDDDAEGDQVEYLVKRQPLLLHLDVDGVEVLGPAVDQPLDLVLLEHVVDDVDDLLDVRLARGAVLVHGVGKLGKDIRLEEAEAEVLQLGLDPVQPQPVGQGRIDVLGLLGDEPLLDRLHVLQGAHVVAAGRPA